MKKARCPACWQFVPGLAKQCPRCGHSHPARVLNTLAEYSLYAFAAVVFGFIFWWLIQTTMR